jgi:RNA-directed DNA polymerase
MDRSDIIDLASRAQGMYHTIVIPVGQKKRIIDVPRPELKRVQRALHDRVFSTITLSESVYSVAGAGVIANAKRHLAQPHMAILDIEACFPTTTVSMVKHALLDAGFDELAATYITALVTLRGRLPQGPPSSPSVMNIVLRGIDQQLDALAAQADVVYTRYMDDLCFSGEDDLHALATHAKIILRKHGFATSAIKNRVWGPADPHTLTKIIVATELNAQPEYVQAISTELSRLAVGANLLTPAQIRGRIAWVGALNPKAGTRLLKRWSSTLGRGSRPIRRCPTRSIVRA